jgi:DNA-binding response OmpR family regulator
MLPGKNGVDVVSQMRKNVEATPVILQTAKYEIEE